MYRSKHEERIWKESADRKYRSRKGKNKKVPVGYENSYGVLVVKLRNQQLLESSVVCSLGITFK